MFLKGSLIKNSLNLINQKNKAVKKYVLLLCLTALCNSLFAQAVDEANVPSAIVKTFNSTFFNVKKVNWEMDYENYIAKFKKDKVETAVTYSKDGKWIGTETPVTHSSLPAPVKSSLVKAFKIYTEASILKIETREGITYAIDIESNQKNYDVVVSERGEILKRELAE